MDLRTKTALEFDKITGLLAEKCITDAARQQALALEPEQNLTLLEKKLHQTADAAELIRAVGLPPLAVTDGLEEMLLAACRGELLTADDLEFVARFCAGCRRTRDYLKKGEALRIELALNARAFGETDALENEIDASVRSGAVLDSASPALRDARRRAETATAQLREKLSAMLRSHPEYYSDAFVVERGGRQTLPVKSAHLRSVPGTAVERSKTGATVFVEPASAARYRESLEQARLDEENEVRRVLYALSALVADQAESLRADAQLTQRLDFIFARGRLGLEMEGVLPEFLPEREIRLENARHPLLPRESAVPLNLKLEAPCTGLAITGPNTGGKTVTLKTLGLFSLMAQSGLMLPARRAQICPFDRVLADIGDGQSLSENLSTFSAHMTAVLNILQQMTPNSLVLADELGSGTDPAEGMGLAVAVMEEFVKKGCVFAVTTHYPQIKEFARSCPSILCARMKFDPATLRPLYELESGATGESCALLIARRLGLPQEVLSRAEAAVRGDVRCHGEAFHATRARFERMEAPSALPERALQFSRGDNVVVSPEGVQGFVVQPCNEAGLVLVQMREGKRLLPYRRLKVRIKAEHLYPEDYDFSIIFDSVENRKARHLLNRRYDADAVVQEEPMP